MRTDRCVGGVRKRGVATWQETYGRSFWLTHRMSNQSRGQGTAGDPHFVFIWGRDGFHSNCSCSFLDFLRNNEILKIVHRMRRDGQVDGAEKGAKMRAVCQQRIMVNSSLFGKVSQAKRKLWPSQSKWSLSRRHIYMHTSVKPLK